jgi:D-alanyl-D-alanine carboxypeptidase
MKHFFYIVFGGLIAIGCGVGFTYGSTIVLRIAANHPGFDLSDFSFSESASASTFISGLKRTVRFSAHEEEDNLNFTDTAKTQSVPGTVTATEYVVKNNTTGEVVLSHNADTSVPIASLTKLVTAVVARRLIDSRERITITDEIISTFGNTAAFTKGETFVADDLLYPLLMVSSNDASEAFARSYGRKKFITAMNDFTQEIGAYRTYFADPSGLSPYNVSTAEDLVRIMDWIRLNDPKIVDITRLKSKTIRTHTWTNPTHFLSWSYYVGGKNGYIPEAQRTGVSLFELGETKNLYTVVVLGSLSRDVDVVNLIGKIK